MKRLLDFLFAAILLLILSPLLLLSALAIKLSSPGPIFFRQRRVGRGMRPFDILKLRTMTVDPNRQLSQTQGGDPEVTGPGRILRRLKIDEMPQLINVLNGDMALVGPRPCMAVTAEEAPDWAKKRFDVRPGLTGLAQVNGNIALSWEERFRHDVRYVEQRNLFMDIGIIFKTIAVVLVGEEKMKGAS
ncbi:sugar transferase [Sphingomicrobium flavum]|uniref:sugar transferase n=1 Tax=Sphingomicrobium flavum TaxID=1229164 RepID=UPI0021AE117C|nr:sugar transferase [Sphingomicrobium flavum]